MQKEDEVWKSIVDYEGKYWISNHGNVSSKNKILKLSIKSNGYYVVSLCLKGIAKKFHVHRLVGLHFVEYDINKIANHLDGDKQNNYYLNIEMTTHSGNNHHAYKSGLKVAKQGEDVSHSKLKNSDVSLIRTSFLSERKLAKFYNVSRAVIRNVKKGKTYKNVI